MNADAAAGRGGLECVFEGICLLGEGPVWNVQEQKLYWTDAMRGRIWRYDPGERRAELFWQGDLRIGGFAFATDGRMVLCAGSGVYLLDARGPAGASAEPRLLLKLPLVAGEIFNDITVDPAGRIFAGTYRGADPVGRVFRIERGRDPVPVIEGISCSNGMSFSLDLEWFYHTNTGARMISRYRYDAETGELSGGAAFFQGDARQGFPDGLTVDAEDHVWSAFWGASAVRRLDPQGAIVQEVAVPARQPSSVMFGGRDLDELYVTSAAQDAFDVERGTDRAGAFVGGKVYRLPVQAKGRPEWLADLG